MAVTLTGYGGVGEIGGNAFLLDDGQSRIFLDFGRRFGNDPKAAEDPAYDTSHLRPGWGDYFDQFLSPRTAWMVRDLAALELIPPHMDIYRPDCGGAEAAPSVEGVVISHAHADHVGLIGLLKPDVPVLMSAESRATVSSLQTTSTGGAEQEFLQVKAKGYGAGKRNPISLSPGQWRTPITRDIRDATSADVGGWQVEQFTVDHSIHGARGSIITGKQLSVAYTGDFRMHGRLKHETAKFVERAAGVDVLMTEGTNVHQEHKHGGGSDDEQSVEGEIEGLVAREGGFVAIAYPPRDLDRLLSIWHVAKKTGRRLVIGTKQAHLLETMRAAGRTDLPDPFADAAVAVHLPRKRQDTASLPVGKVRIFHDDGRPELLDVGEAEYLRVCKGEYQSWERSFLERGNTVTSAEIAADLRAWMFSISFWTITDLFDVFPGPRDERPGGLYIHSMTQPFNDDMEITDRKLHRWLDAFHLRYAKTHVSGHLDEEDLHHVIDEIGAKLLVPIHSLHPDVTADKYHARTGKRALLPQWGQPMPLS